ncbi:hypothetical protein [Cribrihabitans pelagius]|uniref:hypothetical protein n=1 Tax=Cribrihabitans pelagius TaxID=1765746 RepID=UPI003B5CB686
MNKKMFLILFALSSGCGGIPPVDTNTISVSPAGSVAFAEAKRAVRACTALPDDSELFDRFEALGYWSRPETNTASPETEDTSRTGKGGGLHYVLGPRVSHDTGEVIVQAGAGNCYVGLRGMTPAQSYELAQILVTAFDATTNAENGEGLSDHVVQAWQVRDKGRPKVLIAALKTWPWGRGEWPGEPGAAVTLATN